MGSGSFSFFAENVNLSTLENCLAISTKAKHMYIHVQIILPLSMWTPRRKLTNVNHKKEVTYWDGLGFHMVNWG